MEFLKHITPAKAFKIGALAFAGIFVILLGLQIVGSSLSGLMPGIPQMIGGGSGSYAVDYDYAKSEEASYSGMNPMLSIRNTMPIYPPTPGQTTGNTAEAYEVTDYNVSIETRKLDETCTAIGIDLKARKDVIFENSNTYDRGCNFSFKVEHDSVEEVLTIIKDLRPKEISENTFTIKRHIDDFTGETDILKKKLASIDETMRSASNAYDEITRVATQSGDAATLAKIIDSKLQIIERLTQERITINEQLDRLARAKAEQLDRLEYTYFNVNVIGNKYFDAEQLEDSWKAAMRDVVRVVNEAIQGVTVNLVALLALAFQWSLYALLVLLIAKYGWRIGKRIWEQ